MPYVLHCVPSQRSHFVDFAISQCRGQQEAMAFLEDRLYRDNTLITCHSKNVTEDEEIFSSFENFVEFTYA